jgi:hypothetical protein
MAAASETRTFREGACRDMTGWFNYLSGGFVRELSVNLKRTRSTSSSVRAVQATRGLEYMTRGQFRLLHAIWYEGLTSDGFLKLTT